MNALRLVFLPIYVLFHKFKYRRSEYSLLMRFDEYFIFYSKGIDNAGMFRKTLLIWYFVKYKKKCDTKKICDIANILLKDTAILRFVVRNVVLIAESACWEKDKGLFVVLRNRIEKALVSDLTIDYLNFLFAFYFSEGAGDYTDGGYIQQYNNLYKIDYVYYFARARTLESKHNYQDALENYRNALNTLPQDREEYKYAFDACNFILNHS